MLITKIQFDQTDQYFVDRIPFAFVGSDEKRAYFRREDGTGAIEQFSWIALHSIIGGPRWDCIKRPKSVAGSKQKPDHYFCIWELPPTQQQLLLNRWFFVCGLNKLHSGGQVILRPEAVQERYAEIHYEASKAWSAFWGDYGKRYFSSKPHGFGFHASASSILRWNRLIKRSDGRIDALKDNRGQASKLKIDQESFQFIMAQLREYLHEQRKSAAATAEETLRALNQENEKRKAQGERLLETRSRSTLYEWISRFSPVEVRASRDGLKAAKREFAGVGRTERAARPGQTFEVDEWEVDAINLIMESPIREGLDAETLKRLPKDRRWFYVVIDVATRYVLGFVVAATQNAQSAIRALEMATRNKDDLARAAGSASSWHGFPFECVQSDTGSAFRAKATQRAVTETLAAYCYPTVGEPGFRPYIERFFGSLTVRAMPYIPGRTFRDPKERGDYDSEGRAALTDDQLALIV